MEKQKKQGGSEEPSKLSVRDALSCCTRRRQVKAATDLEASESSRKKRKGKKRKRESGKNKQRSEREFGKATCSIFSFSAVERALSKSSRSGHGDLLARLLPNCLVMPPAPLPLSKRPGSIVAAIFFASHIPVTLLVDSQAGEKKRKSLFFSCPCPHLLLLLNPDRPLCFPQITNSVPT